ncbi:small acid-soluble spore protein SspI [Tannockella kyphosi]|uniref:small acid-soluble spore protein SspI n=1 Tax=Tannockella kyphosi TaxID=2899121 RepID=UPI002012E0D1|nr:small acid-soluble spore protein SspI [Tannockella kyphosi]
MNIRVALLEKLHGSTSAQLKDIIQDGINSKEETILPGLGVLFEEYYVQLNEHQKESLLSTLSSLLA